MTVQSIGASLNRMLPYISLIRRQHTQLIPEVTVVVLQTFSVVRSTNLLMLGRKLTYCEYRACLVSVELQRR